ncbi:hypothetical protein SKAU_G00092080 [Synaphobranchus kaupii]|uniref:Uncharacterized protein n=1 Tax=Synaphobranchus kaupii TaxID=118154 RepID=A0A9Q1J4F1_SYNKA|nr:hypothetical protein SKAU_G00092080 [Synaphobranchus kaupii]
MQDKIECRKVSPDIHQQPTNKHRRTIRNKLADTKLSGAESRLVSLNPFWKNITYLRFSEKLHRTTGQIVTNDGEIP